MRPAACALIAVVLGLAAPPAFAEDTLPQPNDVAPVIFPPASLDKPPPGFPISARRAMAIAESGVPAVREARAKHPKMKAQAYVSPVPLRAGAFYHWEVYFKDGDTQLVEVDMDAAGHVLEVQTAPDVGWTLLRGYPGVLGGRLNAPYIWLPLCLLFLLPFLNPRQPFRLLHLDLLVLLGFGISQWFFTRGNPDVSVPLAYPFIAYVVVRALAAGYVPRRRRGPLVPYAPTWLLIGGVVVLLALRAAFGLADSRTLDISTAGVIGADRIEHGLPLYQDNPFHGDTYGPVNYLMYVPFELAEPYEEGTTGGSAARPATVFFDLLIVIGLFVLGRRLRRGPPGTRLGVALAYAWVAFPYSALVIASNTNDALVPLFIVWALVALNSAPARGALSGLATMAKFAPAAVAPALIAGRERLTLRAALVAGGCYVLVCAACVVGFLPDGGLPEFWNTTIGFQLGRTSPLSLWVRHPELDFLRPLLIALALALIVAAAFVPRRRRTGQLAALCAAVLAAIQLPSNYWLYFYIVWFAPLLFVALFEEYRDLGPRDQESETSSLLNPVRISQPSSVTATRSSMRTPSLPGR
jgi:Glycosyltransferase family 87